MRPNQLTVDEIASALKISVSALFEIARESEANYKPPKQITIKGKVRTINPPHPYFKALMRRLHKFIQANFKMHAAAYGSVKNRSCFKAAEKHLAPAVLVTRDIVDCYPSIGTNALKTKLLQLGFQSSVAELFSKFMTLNDAIPQGSPVSGDALNFYLFDVDQELTRLCGGWGKVTRCADDIVISSRVPQKWLTAGQIIESQISKQNLQVNKIKKERNGLLFSSANQLVHAIAVNSKLGTGISNEHKVTAMTIADAYVRAARNVSPDSLEHVAQIRLQLQGWVHYCRQARLSPAAHLGRMLRTGDRLAGRTLKQVEIRVRKWWVVQKRAKINRPRYISRMWLDSLSQ